MTFCIRAWDSSVLMNPSPYHREVRQRTLPVTEQPFMTLRDTRRHRKRNFSNQRVGTGPKQSSGVGIRDNLTVRCVLPLVTSILLTMLLLDRLPPSGEFLQGPYQFPSNVIRNYLFGDKVRPCLPRRVLAGPNNWLGRNPMRTVY
jgi:hypothetical protein